MNRTFLYPILGLLLAGQLSYAQGIRIMPGTTFKLTGGTYNMVLAGGAGFENNAAIQVNDLLLKATGSNASELKGSGPLSLRRLQVNKASGQDILLQKNINVSEGVYFSTGLLDLNGHDLVLADTALLVGESETSHITGTAGAVQITQDLDAPLAVNPGNLGLVITSGASWGSTVIRRSPTAYATAGGGGSIRRSFQVTPANNSGLSAFLRMYYLDAELNALTENTLEFYRSDNGGSLWTDMGAASRNTTSNFVNINNVDNLSLLTLATVNVPLPLTFTELDASCLHNQAQLQWRCAAADRNAFFQVDKSRDGNSWEHTGDKIAAVEGDYVYHYTDKGEIYPYYRLQYLPPDGRATFSTVLPVSCTTENYTFRLLQNPVINEVPVAVQAMAPMGLTVLVYDAQGRQLLQQQEHITAGTVQWHIDATRFSHGIYLLQVRDSREMLWQVKFVKQ